MKDTDLLVYKRGYYKEVQHSVRYAWRRINTNVAPVIETTPTSHLYTLVASVKERQNIYKPLLPNPVRFHSPVPSQDL